MSSGDAVGGRRTTSRRLVAPVAAVVAVAVGVAAVVLAQSATSSFGWFAYAPLSDTTFTPNVGASASVSTVIFGLGLLALVFRLGLGSGQPGHSAGGAWPRVKQIVLAAGILLVLVGALVGSIPHDEFGSPHGVDFAFVAGPELSLAQVAALTYGGEALVAAGLLVLAFWSGRRTAARP